METVPFVVLGSGICGAITALKLKQKFPDEDVALVDQEPYPGHHNTTRNSGVLHAGIYYPTGSLKQKSCIEGRRQWEKLTTDLAIPKVICGKYIISASGDEEATLHSYLERAKANGVEGIRLMNKAELQEISEFTHATAGFYSPKTGILDISTAINTLVGELERLGVYVMLNTKLVSLDREEGGIRLNPDNGEALLARNFFNCAGAEAIGIRSQLGLSDFENKFVKGNYLKLNKPYYNKKLIYPVPQKNLNGLGVHTSFHIDGIVRFGPNTEDVEIVNYQNDEANIDLMYPAISQRFKGIEKSDLSLDYVGVRTKLTKNGQLYTDFVAQSPLPGYYELLGVESPGMTAAPALADELLSLLG